MRRLPTLFIAIDGTLIPGVRRLLREGKGEAGWREAVAGAMPVVDRATRHVRASATSVDDSDTPTFDEGILRQLMESYLETVDSAHDLEAFLLHYGESGGKVVLVLPRFIEQDTTLRRHLLGKLAALDACVTYVADLDIASIEDDSIAVVGRSDEVRAVMRAGKQTIAYVNARRLAREIAMRTDSAISVDQFGQTPMKENSK